MAVVVAGSRARAEQARLQWREQEPRRSPEMAAAPPRPSSRPRPARAAVVYYLARNGHLEHPHFMEVALSCPDGLFLRDVIDRLDALRGKGMARMYSWASKRSYRNGFVWHDLADDDYIHPVVGREYVLKGTERLHPVPPPLLDAAAAAAAASSSPSGSQEDTPTSSSSARWDAHAHGRMMKSASACAADLAEYVVYKGREERAADAATQTEENTGRGHQGRVVVVQDQAQAQAPAAQAQEELLSRAGTSSPPTASTSPETLEALIRADGRRVVSVGGGSGRATRAASSVLMQLISCGSVSVRDARASPVTLSRAHHHQHRARRPPRPAPAAAELPSSYRARVVEDKEYFSGSIVETAKRRSPFPGDDVTSHQDLAVLRRSSSYNAERVIKLELAKEAGDLHDRCIPRKPKSKKDGYLVMSCSAQGNNKG